MTRSYLACNYDLINNKILVFAGSSSDSSISSFTMEYYDLNCDLNGKWNSIDTTLDKIWSAPTSILWNDNNVFDEYNFALILNYGSSNDINVASEILTMKSTNSSKMTLNHIEYDENSFIALRWLINCQFLPTSYDFINISNTTKIHSKTVIFIGGVNSTLTGGVVNTISKGIVRITETIANTPATTSTVTSIPTSTTESTDALDTLYVILIIIAAMLSGIIVVTVGVVKYKSINGEKCVECEELIMYRCIKLSHELSILWSVYILIILLTILFFLLCLMTGVGQLYQISFANFWCDNKYSKNEIHNINFENGNQYGDEYSCLTIPGFVDFTKLQALNPNTAYLSKFDNNPDNTAANYIFFSLYVAECLLFLCVILNFGIVVWVVDCPKLNKKTRANKDNQTPTEKNALQIIAKDAMLAVNKVVKEYWIRLINKINDYQLFNVKSYNISSCFGNFSCLI